MAHTTGRSSGLQWAQCMTTGQRERASRCIKPAVMASAALIGWRCHQGGRPQDLHSERAPTEARRRTTGRAHPFAAPHPKSHPLVPARRPVTTAGAALQGTNPPRRAKLRHKSPKRWDGVAPLLSCGLVVTSEDGTDGTQQNRLEPTARADHSHLGCLERQARGLPIDRRVASHGTQWAAAATLCSLAG